MKWSFLKRTNIEVLNIFQFKIFKYKVPQHLYNKNNLKDDVNRLFESEIVKKYGSQSSERTGEAYSTCGLGTEHITNLSDIKPLLNHISNCILKNFYKEKNSKVFALKKGGDRIGHFLLKGNLNSIRKDIKFINDHIEAKVINE